MTCDCIRCGGSGRPTNRWEVIAFRERPSQRPMVTVRCRVCGSRWSSSSPDAVAAGVVFQAAKGDEPAPAEPPPVVIPAPTLFGATVAPQSQGFVKVGAGLRGRSARPVVQAIRGRKR